MNTTLFQKIVAQVLSEKEYGPETEIFAHKLIIAILEGNLPMEEPKVEKKQRKKLTEEERRERGERLKAWVSSLPPHACLSCGELFQPSGANQKFCGPSNKECFLKTRLEKEVMASERNKRRRSPNLEEEVYKSIHEPS